MNYIFSDTDGTETESADFSLVENLINSNSFEYWTKGSGDTAIQVKDSERLIFFQMKEGYFVIQNPDYLSPLIKKNSNIKTLVHYMGGEPFKLPDSCICTKEQLLDILQAYIQIGELSAHYEWTDIYSLDFDSGY